MGYWNCIICHYLTKPWNQAGLNATWGRKAVFPNDFDLWEVLNYGPDILEKLVETTSNKFWLDVFKSLSFLGKQMQS